MKYLLDVNVLLASVWRSHPQHQRAFDWLAGKDVAVCPLTELGFLRISTQPSAFNAVMDDARTLLEKFIEETAAASIPCDVPALKAAPKTSAQVTDAYLATLAETHGLKLATLDRGIKHAVAVLI